jgi:hypothetical protein
MAGRELCCDKAGLGGCDIPSTSPKGYHTAARGQSQMTHPPVLVRAAPGLPCGRAGARSTRCHTAPARKIIGDPAAPGSLVAKHLIENQVLGERTHGQSEPADDEPLAYIN